MTDYYNMEPMHYWAHPANMSKEDFKNRLHILAGGGTMIWAEKKDGNWSRAIIDHDSKSVLQSRGISKKTGTFTELQDKVLWWKDVEKAFDKTTVILGEIYIPGGIDRDVGSIVRSLTPRALEMQKVKKLEWRIFDVLCYEGTNLMNEPIVDRIKYIDKVVKKINNPLVQGLEYHEMDETFFDEVNKIFKAGGEGAVCSEKTMKYEPGKRKAWSTIKVKQEIAEDIDVFITRIENAAPDYTGKDIGGWQYWQDTKTGEKLFGEYYTEYRLGRRLLRPITRSYYLGQPGAVYCGVYDNDHNVVEICKVAGLTEEMRNGLRDNFDEWNMTCLTLGGMMISDTDCNGKVSTIPSIRHPYIKAIRKGDLNPEDCTLDKIVGGN